MVFTSASFLFGFLPIVLGLYFLCHTTASLRNTLLFIASLVFYTFGEAQYVIVVLVAIAICYFFGRRIESTTGRAQRLYLASGVTLLLIVLLYFKYANFLVATLNDLLFILGSDPVSAKTVRLPLGISFFTFQAISYLVDIYRRDARAGRRFVDVGLYISLFPQLVAGPIVRYRDIDAQLRTRESSLDRVARGVRRFVAGLARKLLLANVIGEVADACFAIPASELTPLIAWIGVICYALQIYFDFSAYSDMAIGLGLIFGFKFAENFNYPYISRSIQEFWRRWHISLSTWFRDYVYIPLGGSRQGRWRTSFNLLTVFVLCGFWHGASWNFLVWGLIHGCFIALERITGAATAARPPRIIQHVYVLLVVLIGWVFFRADNLGHALDYVGAMFGFAGNTASLSLELLMGPKHVLAGCIALLLCTPVGLKLVNIGHPDQRNMKRPALVDWGTDLALIILLAICMTAIAGATFDPFIYFRF